MKSERGVTLISLTVYIIAMLVVVSVMAILSSYFYTNVNELEDNIDPMIEYTKFNSYFTDEANRKDIAVLECNNEGGNSYIVFSNNVQYTFVEKNRSIYKNKVKIARGIDNCKFIFEEKDAKDTVKVEMSLGGKDRNITYTLKN